MSEFTVVEKWKDGQEVSFGPFKRKWMAQRFVRKSEFPWSHLVVDKVEVVLTEVVK